ncbi:cupin domain-containing protein [Moritella sp. Urea-trap-13]|uniref:cupin domain-containing protein n=1 Tax=Moritella sp. Urea-trap-13 TaxID=2058327 RepID=UPI000C321AF0|nr:cupin domain-containing protein [Moritella sp. Urea-trap-13]PKH05995.1 anti-sigma factor [Moritella sp. Urea-trap-13]
MNINSDLTQAAKVFFNESTWVPSPLKGVSRKMLERDGEEFAATPTTPTTLVVYDADSYFTNHIHTGGEEFLVLAGVFADEHGAYPVGTYKRNPVGTEHAPIVKDGCMIIVKLGQFQEGDDQDVTINTASQAFIQDERRAAVQYQALHAFKQETVRLERWARDSHVTLENTGGIEVLVVDGELNHQGDVYNKYDWLRLPIGEALDITTGADDCTVWIKTGHHTYRL